MNRIQSNKSFYLSIGRPRTISTGIVIAGGYREVCRGRVGYVAGGGFWGGSKDLMQRIIKGCI